MQRVEIVVIGNPNVGKTCFVMKFVQGSLPKKFTPSVFQQDYPMPWRTYFGVDVDLTLWDTPDTTYDSQIYSEATCFLCMFDVTSSKSLRAIETRYYRSIMRYRPEAPIILIGTKTDLRDKDNKRHVSTEKAVETAKKINAHSYIETSAVTGVGLYSAITEATTAALLSQGFKRYTKAPKKTCSIM
mmetsp:Transcript_14622/g.16232  ORF Transcript_14622/g.16232 Transcript_14622/m.16232 type:complete len:186 (+) Transcript_14622:248-805(+)